VLLTYICCVLEKAEISALETEVLGHKGDWMPTDFLEHKKSAVFDKGLMGDAQQQLEGKDNENRSSTYFAQLP
jgi:hypothetical protein